MRLRQHALAAIALAAALAVAFSSGVSAQERFGALSGTVTDASQAPVPGATVTVTNKQTGAVRTAVSGGAGGWTLPDLDPGRYSVSIELSGFQKVLVDDVIVLLGRTIQIPAVLKVGGVTETVNVTAQAERQIDLTSTTLAHNITSEEIDRMPKARTFQQLALAAPGVNGLNGANNSVEGGIQVNGASAAENVYTIDGVTTNSPIEGQSRQDTVFEYLQEVQVKTAGIQAEYGGALGGVISAVTRSGGNTFRGEGHYYYLGNGLAAAPVQRLVLNPLDNSSVSYFNEAKQKDNRNEVGGSIGGPIIRDRLFFFESLSPRVVNRTNNYLFSNGTEPGSISSDQTLWQQFAKLTYSSSRVQANGSWLLTPQRVTGTLPAYLGFGPNWTVSSLAANQPNETRGYNVDQHTLSGNVDVWLTSSSFISVRGGYFFDKYQDTGVSQVTSYTYREPSSNSPVPVPPELQGGIGYLNTPRVQITQFDTTKQPYLQMDYNHSLHGLGDHVVKAGVGYRRTINDVNSAYPGGYVYIFWGNKYTSTVTGVTDTGTYGYYQVNDFGTVGQVGANIWSLYAQDAWTVGNRLTLNLGVRTENEKLPTFVPDHPIAFQFGFGDKIAPRLGASYDLRGDGRMKLSAFWGRFYDWTKYELVRGSFGGDIWHRYTRSLDTTDLGSLNLSNMPGRDLQGGFEDLRGTAIENTDPNIQPMYQDSFQTGWDYQLNPTTAIGVHYIHNTLNRTIEDLGAFVNGNDIYVIGNPGEGTNTVFPPTYPAATPPFPTPLPKRQYDALEVTAERRFARGWFASANYTFSRLYGNYPGTSNTDEYLSSQTTGLTSGTAQQQGGSLVRQGSNSNAAYDVDEILWDAYGHSGVYGRLPTDRPHVVKLYGGYTFRFGTQLGLFFYGASGTPVSTYVIEQPFGYNVLVNGRGDVDTRNGDVWRTPVLTRTDLLVAHDLPIGGRQRLRFELNVTNLFNQQTAMHIFNWLNKGAPGESSFSTADAAVMSNINLTQPYNYNAAILASSHGAAAYDPRYGQPDLFQPGTQGQISVRWSF
jgi:hypothetical protein